MFTILLPLDLYKTHFLIIRKQELSKINKRKFCDEL